MVIAKELLNVLVLGGSYVGCAVAQKLAAILPSQYRVLLVEPNSHFSHLFVFPRFAVVKSHEHKAFIPYSNLFAESPSPDHRVIRAKATRVKRSTVTLDRPWIDGCNEIPYSFLVLATGTTLPFPGSVPTENKQEGIEVFRNFQAEIEQAQNIVIIGGGAVGVQMACDLKDVDPNKNVTLIHSRQQLMPNFHPALHDIVMERFKELGVKPVLGARAVVPSGGFPTTRATEDYEVELQDGRKLSADLIIPATGQKANTAMVSDMSPSVIDEKSGFISVRPTLQMQSEAYNNIFAVGDIANSGAHKAARPGVMQAEIVAQNIISMIHGQIPVKTVSVSPPAIHMSLGITKNVLFINPPISSNEPKIVWREDGVSDMGVERQWKARKFAIKQAEDYYL